MSSDAWKEATIGDAVEPVSRPERVTPDQTYRLLGVRWYGRGCHLHATAAGVSLKTPQLNRVAAGDVTYNKMWVTKGAFAVVGSDCHGLTATSEYPLFAVRGGSAIPEYLRWAMTTDTFVRAATDSSRGSTSRRRLNPSDFLSLPVPLPPLGEQRKIAAILSAVDDAIEATQAVIDQLQIVKKAMMAELLTRGLPGRHTRFKQTDIGEVPEGWEVVQLQELATVERGKFSHRPRNDPRFYGGAHPFIQTGDVAASDGRISSFSQTLNEEGLAVSRLFPAGTIVITIAANIGDTGIAMFPVAFPDSLVGIRVGELIDNRFLELVLRTRKTFLEESAPQNAQKNINLETLRPLLIQVPPAHEQAEIARLFDVIRNRVEAEKTGLAAAKAAKAALTASLLTGEVRVTPEEVAA